MSFLRRIASRAGVGGPAVPFLVPKPQPGSQMPLVSRLAEPGDEESAGALEEREPEAQREATEEEPETQGQATEEEPEAQRQAEANPEDEESAQRMAAAEGSEDDQEEVMARRQESAVGDEIETERAPTPEEMEPANAPPLEEMPEEAAVTDVRTMRRVPAETDHAAAVPTSSGREHARHFEVPFVHAPAVHGKGAMAESDRVESIEVAEAGSFDFSSPEAVGPGAPRSSSLERPQVIIDQLDVLIHEPTPAARSMPTVGARRALRARYLRRL